MARSPHAGDKGTCKLTIQTKRPPQTLGPSSHSFLSGSATLTALAAASVLLVFYLVWAEPASEQFASTWISKCATGKSWAAATLRGKVHLPKKLCASFPLEHWQNSPRSKWSSAAMSSMHHVFESTVKIAFICVVAPWPGFPQERKQIIVINVLRFGAQSFVVLTLLRKTQTLHFLL